MTGGALHVLLAVALAGAGMSEEVKRAESKRLFRAGAAAYEAGRYLAAAQALEQAYEITPLPAVAFSLAQAYRLQFFADEDYRHLDRAIALYRVYLDAVARGGRRADAVSALADLEPIATRLEQQRAATAPPPIAMPPVAYEPPTQLMVISETEGALGSVDGAAPAALPLIIEVKPGKHEAKITADGYHDRAQSIVAVEGRLVVAEVELDPRPANVEVAGPNGATVWVNGRGVGTLPLSRPLSLPAGRYRLTLTHRGHRPWARDITVERGGEAALVADVETTLQRELSYYVFAAGGATILGSGIVGLLALADDQDATRLLDKREVDGLTLDEADEYERLALRRNSRVTTTVAVLGVGVALAVTGGMLFYLDDPHPRAEPVVGPAAVAKSDPVRPHVRMDVGLLPGLDGGQVGLSGRF